MDCSAFLSTTTVSRISIGTPITTVLEAVGPRPSIVCNVRSCIAPGLSAIVLAARARLTAASLSPSALVIVARFSRSADACARHHLLELLGHVDVLNPQAGDLQAPALGVLLDMLLDRLGDLLPLGQELIQRQLADDVAERGLGILRRPRSDNPEP